MHFNKAKKIFLFSVISLSLLYFTSCSRDDKTTAQKNNAPKTQIEDIDDTGDTVMTAEEKFSTAILIDFLDDSNDADLAEYLESEIFKMSANYKGASVIEITPSTWLVMFEKDGATKNYLIQKYVDFTTNDNYFRMKETTLTATDVIAKGKNKTSIGE
jgi:hypothetical protein